jgi:hypothetical protein
VRRSTLLVALALAGASTAAAGCGGDDGPTSATVVQEPTTAVAPATGPDATVPTTTTATPPTTGTSTTTDTNPTATTGVPSGGVTTTAPETGGAPAGGEEGQGGAGDEEAVRVPVALTTDGGALSPTIVTVPAFLAIELRVTAKGGAEKLTITAPGGGTLAVAAGQTATKRLTGLKPGDYAVTTAGGGKATLHVVRGGDPGP